jgi:DNA-binding transcriptional ArsR family regulator
MKRSIKCVNQNLTNLSGLLRVLSEESRLRTICFLQKKEHCACEIAEFLALPHNLVSHHLKALKEAKLVSCRREGKFLFYSINRVNFNNFLGQFKSIMGGCK